MKLIKKDKKGFTLVELIVVIAILAILALILIPAITGYVAKANKVKDEANTRAIYSAAMFELNTSTDYDDADAAANTALANKVKTDLGLTEDVTVVITGNTVKVTYNNVSFDGKEFDPK